MKANQETSKMKLPKAFLLIGIAWSMLGTNCVSFKHIYREYKPESCFDESKTPKNVSFNVAGKELFENWDGEYTVDIRQESTCEPRGWHNYLLLEDVQDPRCYTAHLDNGKKNILGQKIPIEFRFAVVRKSENLILLAKHTDRLNQESTFKQDQESIEKYLFNKIYDSKCLSAISEWQEYQEMPGSR